MKNLVLLLAGLSLGAATILPAQTAPADDASAGPRHGRGPHGPGRGGSPIVRALDADHNRELSAAEIAQAPAALRALDRNGDGSVSLADLRPADAPARPPQTERPERAAGSSRGSGRGRPVDPVMLALDADQDRTLSATEIANATRSLLALDANSDGKLTADELRPLPPAKD